MAAVTKVIRLPAPVNPVPPVVQWGVAQLQFNPITETASVLLVAVNADGTQIAGGASKSFGVNGATYRQLFSAQLAASLVGMINTAGKAAGIFAEGSTVEDAE
jgi:hypothetical protein